MIVYHFCTSINEANAYILIDPETKQALLIDVPEWTPMMEQVLVEQQAQLKGVFITHEHYDHISGLQKLRQRYNGLKQYPEKVFFHNPNMNKTATLKLGDYEGQIISLPGHTPESVGLYIDGIIFTGDALFAGSVGGTISSLQAKQQIEAIKTKILTLPENTLIFPGHGPITLVSTEKKYNPFLQP